MSLINEALKKAQRQRTAAPVGDAMESGQGRPVEKRGAPMRVQTLVMLAIGAGALIVVSVVVTVLWVNRKIETPAAAHSSAVASAKPPSTTPTPETTPIVVAPLPASAPASTPAPAKPAEAETVATPPPTTVAKPVPAPLPTEPAALPAAPETTAAQVATTTESPQPTTTTPAVEPPPVVAAAPKPRPASHPTASPQDPRILTFIDAIRVTGIRSSGSESKVLMNDRVYRVNDVVERTLGLKLIKVEPEALTFADPNGVVYTKTF